MTVTLVTRDATLDDLSTGDYRDIFNELREKMSLDKLVAFLGSQYSKAQWSKYEHSVDFVLTRTMRNELRHGVGLPALPLTVEEATRQASPDAAVWRVGDGVPEHILLVGAEPITLYVDSGVQVVTSESRVTRVTAGSTPRKRYARPCVSESQNRRFLALPSGSTWSAVIEAGLTALESTI